MVQTVKKNDVTWRSRHLFVTCALAIASYPVLADTTQSPSFGDVKGDVTVKYGLDEKALSRHMEDSWRPKLDEMTFAEQQTTRQIIGMMSPKEINQAERLLESFHANTKEAKEFKNRYYTSVYFANKRYEQALETVLRRYKGLPLTDVRYRKDIAYIIYNMRVDKELDYAEQLITKLRRNNKRPDLSYVWMGIHPGPLLRMYEKRLSPYQEMHPKQQNILRYVMDKYPEDRFIDYALYLLHDYDEIIKNHPNSTLREEAYYAKAYRKYYLDVYEKKEQIVYELVNAPLQTLEPAINTVLNSYYTYLERYPNGSYAAASLKHMADAISALRDANRVAEELQRLLSVAKTVGPGNSDQQIDGMTYVAQGAKEFLVSSPSTDINSWLDRLPQSIHKLIDKDEIYLRRAREAFKNRDYITATAFYSNVQPKSIKYYKDEKLRIKQLGRYTQLRMAHAAGDITEEKFLFDSAMTLKKTRHDAHHAIPFFDAYLQKATNVDLAQIEMLKAFSYRDSSNGEEMLQSLWKVVNEHPAHPLADDALTEIGVYYLLWERDGSRARMYMDQVISRFPDGNAVDNAMNWKAWSLMRDGEYTASLNAYLELVRKEPLSRFVDYAFSNIVKSSIIEGKGIQPMLHYFQLTGKRDLAGVYVLNSRPVVFHGNRQGRVKVMDVDFEYTTKINRLTYNPETRFALFRARDYKYTVRYAWHVDNNELFFVALNRETNKKSRSKNYRQLSEKEAINHLNGI